MLVKLFVANLPWTIDDEGLSDLFRGHGEVQRAYVSKDRDTGRSKGFGFVDLETSDAATVINATNGMDVDGRPLRVNEAEDRPRSGGGGGGGGFRRDSNGGGGGGYGGGSRGGGNGGSRGGGSRSRY